MSALFELRLIIKSSSGNLVDNTNANLKILHNQNLPVDQWVKGKQRSDSST